AAPPIRRPREGRYSQRPTSGRVEIGVVSLQATDCQAIFAQRKQTSRTVKPASRYGRLACTTSLFVAARSWTAPARPHSLATLPSQTARLPASAASRDLPGARSTPTG